MASPTPPHGGPDSDSIAERLKKQFGDKIEPTLPLDPEPAPDTNAPSTLFDKLRGAGTRGTRYRLLGEVARGGMGVILKIWDDELRRTLAMKVVFGRGDESKGDTPHVDPKTLGRFLEEAQVTGQLDHPGIVPVHELGLGADGRVYFTMRLVKGEDLRSIFEKVRASKDGWNQVRALGVLLKVCEAMSYAHSKKVVHRDLKPANVMVGKFGEVYVMDWGLARVLGREDKHDLRIQPQPTTQSVVKTERRETRHETPDSPLVTMDGDIVGTPSFMPPEQAKGQLDKLGPHSDVYSLGAMLYQLVTAEMPYVPKGAVVSQRMILEAVLRHAPEPIESLAPATSPELVAICEKAMAREISARYADTQAFAADLRAYLEGRVVHAYETGAWAETRKWLRRNKPLALALSLAFMTLLALFITSTLLYRRSVRGETTARANEVRATAKALEAQELAAEASRQKSVAEAAQARSDKLKRELEEMAGSLASTLTELGNLLKERGELTSAEPLFRRAVDSASLSLGDNSALTITAKSNLANLLLSQGKLSEAEGLYRDSWQRSEKVLGSDSPVTIAALSNLVSVLRSAGKLQEAVLFAKDAVARRRRILGDAHPDTLRSINNLASLLSASGELGLAETLARETLAAYRSMLPKDHPDTLTALGNLASILADANNVVEADSLLHDALAMSRSSLGDDHRDTLLLVSKLASVEMAIGNLGEAETLYREALTRRRRIYGDDHPSTLEVLGGLASVLVAEKLPEAESVLRDLLGRAHRVLGPGHPKTEQARLRLIQLYEEWHLVDPSKGYDLRARELTEEGKR